jgi:hypothetical protein
LINGFSEVFDPDSVMPSELVFTLESSWLISLRWSGASFLLFIAAQFKTFNHNSAWHQLEKFNKKRIRI